MQVQIFCFPIPQYTGTWYQLQRYPYPEVADASTCVGTRITAQNGNAASLLNWAVVDGELVTAEAQATVAEGSATLQVTVPIPDSTNGKESTATSNTSAHQTIKCSNSLWMILHFISYSKSRFHTVSAEFIIFFSDN